MVSAKADSSSHLELESARAFSQDGTLVQSPGATPHGHSSPLESNSDIEALNVLGLGQHVPPSGGPQSLWDRFSSNPIFSGGFGLMGLGLGVTVLRRGLIASDTLLRRRLFVTLEIPSTDRAHPWVLQWISKQRTTGRSSANNRDLETHQLSLNTIYTRHENGAGDVAFEQVPGEGLHWVKYRGAWLQIKRERNGRMVDIKSGTPWETIQVTTLSRDRGLFSTMLNEAYSLGTQAVENKTVVYTAWNVEWRPLGPPRRKRELESVVLAKGLKESLLEDIQLFLERSQWYADRGIPYRRGYLLSGPPGSGKSSFVQALAGELSMDICILNLSERGLTDDKLNHLLINAPSRCIFLLEDIDAAFNKRSQTSSDGYQSSVTFSGLLNALDGVGAAEERIVFMTTNHAERLDSALIRPGRVDRHEVLGDATPEQAEELFQRFYRDSPGLDKLSDKLRRSVAVAAGVGKGVSMAALQGHFIQHNADIAVRTVDELWTISPVPASNVVLEPRRDKSLQPEKASAAKSDDVAPASERLSEPQQGGSSEHGSLSAAKSINDTVKSSKPRPDNAQVVQRELAAVAELSAVPTKLLLDWTQSKQFILHLGYVHHNQAADSVATVAAGELLRFGKMTFRMPSAAVWMMLRQDVCTRARSKLRTAGLDTTAAPMLDAVSVEIAEFQKHLQEVENLKPSDPVPSSVQVGDVISFPSTSLRIPSGAALMAMRGQPLGKVVEQLGQMGISLIGHEMRMASKLSRADFLSAKTVLDLIRDRHETSEDQVEPVNDRHSPGNDHHTSSNSSLSRELDLSSKTALLTSHIATVTTHLRDDSVLGAGDATAEVRRDPATSNRAELFSAKFTAPGGSSVNLSTQTTEVTTLFNEGSVFLNQLQALKPKPTNPSQSSTKLVAAGEIVAFDKGTVQLPSDAAWVMLGHGAAHMARRLLRRAGVDTAVGAMLEDLELERKRFWATLNAAKSRGLMPAMPVIARAGDSIELGDSSLRIPSGPTLLMMAGDQFPIAIRTLASMGISVIGSEITDTCELRAARFRRVQNMEGYSESLGGPRHIRAQADSSDSSSHLADESGLRDGNMAIANDADSRLSAIDGRNGRTLHRSVESAARIE